ncbi:hypothetical protein [Haloarcula sp. Atlit-7R]|jgi:hypothetical protein|uniref:hypothetical protein n=1 Tax=Haloarcula sp. Atlit-7R TaxID=2282125 RepID=UPI000EF152AF|nr:hypothetical protein [Haloarcula sp. Atlit-7R]RLM94367.1 hypothetical protein D3D01_16015 [Haloarcula sp. Atlit-7R]
MSILKRDLSGLLPQGEVIGAMLGLVVMVLSSAILTGSFPFIPGVVISTVLVGLSFALAAQAP